MKQYCISICLFFLFLGDLPIQAQDYTELAIQGIEALEEGAYEEAEEFFKKALQLEPANIKNALLFSNLGSIQRMQRRYDEALESYTLALNITPYSIPILMNRATAYMELGELRKAYIDYCKVLDLDSEAIEALLMRAYIAVSNRDYGAARIDYNRILSLDETHYNAQLGLATLAQTEKRYSEATDILNRMIHDHPQDDLLLLARANVAFDQEQWDVALLDLEEAESINSQSAEVQALMGKVFLKMEKKHLAKKAFENAIQLGYPQVELSDLLKQCK
ncbi:MAG: tetratricopeptide repeat protein [Bacteroides sp.]|nr:tetratricopeptide repeat protein [Bacteroides sp.]MDD4054859.1 tetratricopeptide repeat protein [Bacteroides sp.]MDD4719380.1 tetratricopeptide repeat protein [Bacteroides sp.]NLI63900.1 tetratricopeptide repeat protein [Bacteroidales bacterium]